MGILLISVYEKKYLIILMDLTIYLEVILLTVHKCKNN